MDRRDFLTGLGGLAAVMAGCKAVPENGAQPATPGARTKDTSSVPDFAKGAEEMPPIFTNATIVRSPLAQKGPAASFFIDDAIWTLRDITRQRPQSMFENPFMAVLKECHERYGLKMQFNLFYRTDFFYGLDEFTLANVSAAYRNEWQANKDWLKLGFHSLQEFPDYPWINVSYADMKKLFGRIRGEIERFAGPGVFTPALVPHWCPMSQEGCQALKDCGVRIMECTVGPRYRYDGKRERLPYGHGLKLEQNRKPEVGFYWRDSRNAAIASSICSYNHITAAQAVQTELSFNYLHDNVTGMNFKHMFCDAPCLNLVDVPTLKSDIAKISNREYLIFSDHEQYFYKDYLAYQADYSEKIRVMSAIMHAQGRNFALMEELV